MLKSYEEWKEYKENNPLCKPCQTNQDKLRKLESKSVVEGIFVGGGAVVLFTATTIMFGTLALAHLGLI